MGRVADPVVKRFVAGYLPRLRRRYEPELVLVFGSRARGEALVDSDLDLLVVSERFRDVPFLERPVRLLTDVDLPFPVDVLCYTPEEFARKRSELGIVGQALEDGLTIWSRTRARRAARRSSTRRRRDRGSGPGSTRWRGRRRVRARQRTQ